MKNEQTTTQSTETIPNPTDPAATALKEVGKRQGKQDVNSLLDEIIFKGTAPDPANIPFPTGNNTPPVLPWSEQDRELCRDTLRELTKLSDLLAVNAVESRMVKLRYHHNDISAVIQQVPMKPELREGIVKAGALTCEKYGFKVGPEVTLAALGVSYIYGLMQLLKEINKNAPPIPKQEDTTIGKTVTT